MICQYILSRLPPAFSDALLYPTFVCTTNMRSIKVLSVFADPVAKQEMAEQKKEGGEASAEAGEGADEEQQSDSDDEGVPAVEQSRPALLRRGPGISVPAALSMQVGLLRDRSADTAALGRLHKELEPLLAFGSQSDSSRLSLALQVLRSRPLLESPLLSGGIQATTARMRQAAQVQGYGPSSKKLREEDQSLAFFKELCMGADALNDAKESAGIRSGSSGALDLQRIASAIRVLPPGQRLGAWLCLVWLRESESAKSAYLLYRSNLQDASGKLEEEVKVRKQKELEAKKAQAAEEAKKKREQAEKDREERMKSAPFQIAKDLIEAMGLVWCPLESMAKAIEMSDNDPNEAMALVLQWKETGEIDRMMKEQESDLLDDKGSTDGEGGDAAAAGTEADAAAGGETKE